MKLMQYVGSKELTKDSKVMIFMDITNMFIYEGDGVLHLLTKRNYTYTPIPESEYSKCREMTPRAGRYEVYTHGDVLEMTENDYKIVSSAMKLKEHKRSLLPF